ncbi:MAG: RibD family protein [Caulobacteraceae bacterium]
MKVTLTLATSLDGRVATASGESGSIVGEASREKIHLLRAMHSGILVGVETAVAGDPELTVRLPGYVGAQPARIVMDSHQRIPLTCKLVKTARRARTVVASIEASNKRLTDAGVEVVQVDAVEGRCDALATLKVLERMGQFAIMIEGGSQVASSFLLAGLVDQLEWFRAPIILGDEGWPAVAAFVLKDLARAPRLRRTSVEAVGEDLWERYERV